MAKNYITDHIAVNVADDASVIAGNIAAQLSAIMEVEGERFSAEPIPLNCNIPATEGEGENEVLNWQFGQNDQGEIIFEMNEKTAETFTNSQIAIVAIWHDPEVATVPQAEGEALKSLKALYILALPNIATIRRDKRLGEYMEALLQRDTLQKARSLARNLEGGKDGYALTAEPVAQFLGALAKAAGREAAYNAMWTFIRDYMLRTAGKAIAAQKAAGNHAMAARIASIYSRQRLNKETLKACLSSQTAAEHHLPEMVNTDESKGPRGLQWDNILKMLVTMAPNFAPMVIQKDENGQTVKDDEGKAVRVAKPKPQSPAIFAQWLASRYEIELEVKDDIEIAVDF